MYSPDASIWSVRFKASLAVWTIFPEGLKLMSRSKMREEAGEKVVHRLDKGQHIPVVNSAALLLAHSPADAAY